MSAAGSLSGHSSADAAAAAASNGSLVGLALSRLPPSGLLPLLIYPALSALPIRTLLGPFRLCGLSADSIARLPSAESAAVRQQVISLLHSSWVTVRALSIVMDGRWHLPGASLVGTPHPALPSLCAQELAYLLFDTALMWKGRAHGALLRGNLLVHHFLFSTALAAYLLHSDTPRAQFFTAVLFLFNASTPLLTLRQLMKKYATRRSALLDLAVLLTFFVCRIAIMIWLLSVFERSKGGEGVENENEATAAASSSAVSFSAGLSSLLSAALSGFHRLPWYCRSGTIVVTLLNSVWMTGLLLKLIGERTGGRKLKAFLAKTD